MKCDLHLKHNISYETCNIIHAWDMKNYISYEI